VTADVRRALEAIVMVADSPVEAQLLAQLTETSQEVVEHLLAELAAEYRAAERGFELAQVAGGWRFQSSPAQASYVERFVLEGQTAKLSAAALETLAIIAYKQPISRAQVAAIRGVSVDGVVRTLEQRGYITEIARDPGPGQAILFGTTPLFLDKLGLNSLSDLPGIADFVPGADVVEALEHGLRVEISAPEVTADDASGNGGGRPAPAPWPPPPAVAGGSPADDADDPPLVDQGLLADGGASGDPDPVAPPIDTTTGGDPSHGPAATPPPGQDRRSLDDLLDGEG
jgi:segregation and condensation protein B